MLDDPEEGILAGGGKGAGARVSIHNVAAYAGVSIATVSKVMQGVPTVLPENVTKVQNAIEALGYRINPLGAELRRGRRNLIGLVVPTLEDKDTARLVGRLELAVERRSYVLFVASSHKSEKREADLAGRMLGWRVAGVVIVPVVGQESPAALLLEDAGMPAVFVSAEGNGLRRFDTIVRKEIGAKDADGLAGRIVETLLRRIDQPKTAKA
jgi:DNA-binding LacI/PurR family transcriptional regulator